MALIQLNIYSHVPEDSVTVPILRKMDETVTKPGIPSRVKDRASPPSFFAIKRIDVIFCVEV